jgi:dTMP kinase
MSTPGGGQPPASRQGGFGRPPVATVPSPPGDGPPGGEGDVRAVLRIPEFRRLWLALSLSSLGDWMGLLATTALASTLQHSFSGKAYAIGSVLIVRLLPALIFGPLSGAVADRLDRRMTMVLSDVLRFALFVTIPLVGTLEWLLIASFLVECVSLFWNPAKDASMPNLVPESQLPAANTLSLITTYGTAPVGAAVFALLSTMSRALASEVSFFRTSPVDLALYFDAGTFLVSGVVIWGLRLIGRPERGSTAAQLGFWASITEGWRFVGGDRLVRGLVIGILGGFAGAGCVVALGRLYVQILGGGDSAYGVLFGAVFVGLAGGMAMGPKLLGDYNRGRLFGLSVTAAGVTLVLVAIVPNIVLACILVVLVGGFAGIAWVTGYTLLQAEVADDLRGRTFALVQSLVRIDLLLVLAAAPAMVGLIGSHHITLWNHAKIRADGVTIVLLGGGLLAVTVGLFAYRQMDERAGVAVLPELWAALRGRRPAPVRAGHPGIFLAFEGGEGTGKTTQVDLLRAWLADVSGREVVVTREPGGTAVGTQLRALLLDPARDGLCARTEALLYAADRAEHVARVVEPALARGAIVVSDRYVDSSIAYQGAGRQLDPAEIARLSRWATEALVPDLTIMLDLAPEVGLGRARAQAAEGPDRIEAEALEFHQRVRARFLALAAADPRRYATVDATPAVADVHAAVREVVRGLLGDRPRPWDDTDLPRAGSEAAAEHDGTSHNGTRLNGSAPDREPPHETRDAMSGRSGDPAAS